MRTRFRRLFHFTRIIFRPQFGYSTISGRRRIYLFEITKTGNSAPSTPSSDARFLFVYVDIPITQSFRYFRRNNCDAITIIFSDCRPSLRPYFPISKYFDPCDHARRHRIPSQFQCRANHDADGLMLSLFVASKLSAARIGGRRAFTLGDHRWIARNSLRVSTMINRSSVRCEQR